MTCMRIILLAGAAISAAAVSTPALADATPECNVGTGIGSTECGVDSAATADGATALGNMAVASGAISTATGQASVASATASTSYGSLSVASGIASTALGHNSDATALGSTAVGVSAQATAVGATSLGRISNAAGPNSTSLGAESDATADRATAVGYLSQATGVQSAAIGEAAVASGLASSALGAQAVASGIASTALGHNSDATALASTAVGVSAQATATGATALGRLANAAHAGSTAIGANSATTADNQLVLGGTGSHVRVGDIAASTSAQNAASIGVATVDANGVLGRNTTILPAIASLQSSFGSQATAISALQSDTVTLFELTQDLRSDVREANEGVAMALALDSPTVPAGARFAASGGIGHFKKRTALAAAVSAAVGEMSSVSAGLGYGLKSKEIGARAGFQIAW